MLTKNAIVPVRMCRTPRKKWRPVIDPSVLNNHLSVPTFKMETAEVIRNTICRGEWVVSIGLTDAYFHIPIHEKSQHFLRFHVAGKTYQFRALPFGIATAPLKFSRVVKEVKLMLQNRGIHIHQYLDDWLLRAPSEEICLQQSKQLVAFVQELGWVINFQKSELKPTPNFDFLGYRFDLTKGQVSPTEKKWQILKKAIHQLQNSLTTTPRVLMSLIGVLASLEKTVSMGRLHMRPFQWYLKTHWRYPQSLDMKIPCSDILKSHLNWWRDPNNELIGTPLHAEEHNLLLFTDASVKGWGAHLEDQTVSGLWSYTEKNLHINVLVLKAVFLAIRSFQSHLLNKRVLVASDNVTVVSYLNKQGRTHSLEMCLMIWRLMAFCKPRAIWLRARHIQGCLICLIWHRPMVDMFATKMNNKLPLYVSPVPDPNAMAIDALNISWQALDSYAYCYNRIYTNRMVSSSKDFSEDLPNLAQTNGRYVCNQDEQQATSLCISSPRPKCNSNRCIEYLVAGSRRLCLLSHSSDTKNDSKNENLCLSNDCNSSRLARDELVLGSNRTFHKTSTTTSTLGNSSQTAVQSKVSPKSSISEPSCLAPGLQTSISQKFSESVAERIKTPQRVSSRKVYESRWAIFESWC